MCSSKNQFYSLGEKTNESDSNHLEICFPSLSPNTIWFTLDTGSPRFSDRRYKVISRKIAILLIIFVAVIALKMVVSHPQDYGLLSFYSSLYSSSEIIVFGQSIKPHILIFAIKCNFRKMWVKCTLSFCLKFDYFWLKFHQIISCWMQICSEQIRRI